MDWWNGLTEPERGMWLARAGSASASDAWAYYKASLAAPRDDAPGIPPEQSGYCSAHALGDIDLAFVAEIASLRGRLDAVQAHVDEHLVEVGCCGWHREKLNAILAAPSPEQSNG